MYEPAIREVRQIMQYPLKAAASPADAVLIQTGHLGAPYAYTTAWGVVTGALGWGAPGIAVGFPVPHDAECAGVMATRLTSLLGCTQGFNWYKSDTCQRYLQNGGAGEWCFDGATLVFAIAPPGAIGDQVAPFVPALEVTASGLFVPGVISAGGIPLDPTDLATKGYVDAQFAATVHSFNGRQGDVTLTLTDVTTAGAAPLASPAFTGNPTSTSPPPGDNSSRLAVTSWVDAAIASAISGATFGFAPLNSPNFSGVPTAPTPAPGNNSPALATTAFVTAALTPYALIASPTFTGTPAGPTAAPGTNTTQLATTAYVMAAVAASTAGVATWNGRTGTVVMTTADVTGVGGALLASPAFTGAPTAPTAALGTNTTQLATTGFVSAALAAQVLVASFNGRTGAVTLTTADVTAVGGLTAVAHDATLIGNGTAASPLGLAATPLTTVAHDGTLTGNGTAASPLGVVPSLQASKNLIINPDMAVAQFYGNTAASGLVNVGTYPIDQWRLSNTGVLNLTAQRIQSAGPTPTLWQWERLTVATAMPSPGSNDFAYFSQPLEGVRAAPTRWGTADAQPITVSGYVWSTVAGTMSLVVQQIQASPYSAYVTDFAVTANAWTYFQKTIPPDPNGVYVFDTVERLRISLSLVAGSGHTTATRDAWISSTTANTIAASTSASNFMALAGAQVGFTGITCFVGSAGPAGNQIGAVLRPFAEELALCQRYGQFAQGGFFGNAGAAGVTFGSGVNFATPMRAAPTVTITTTLTNSGFTSFGASNVTATGFMASGVSAVTSAIAYAAVYWAQAQM